MLALLPQVAIADAACIVALPLVIDPVHVGRAALGALAVILIGGALFAVLLVLERKGYRRRLHEVSEERNFALELRISLLMLFLLAAVATLVTGVGHAGGLRLRARGGGHRTAAEATRPPAVRR